MPPLILIAAGILGGAALVRLAVREEDVGTDEQPAVRARHDAVRRDVVERYRATG